MMLRLTPAIGSNVAAVPDIVPLPMSPKAPTDCPKRVSLAVARFLPAADDAYSNEREAVIAAYFPDPKMKPRAAKNTFTRWDGTIGVPKRFTEAIDHAIAVPAGATQLQMRVPAPETTTVTAPSGDQLPGCVVAYRARVQFFIDRPLTSEDRILGESSDPGADASRAEELCAGPLREAIAGLINTVHA